jgi:UDP-N-acetylglucosamine 4,6-dehydratase
VELDDSYVILPALPAWGQREVKGKPVPDGFLYSSDNNPRQVSSDEMAAMLRELGVET